MSGKRTRRPVKAPSLPGAPINHSPASWSLYNSLFRLCGKPKLQLRSIAAGATSGDLIPFGNSFARKRPSISAPGGSPDK